jgi:hypothetical protein
MPVAANAMVFVIPGELGWQISWRLDGFCGAGVIRRSVRICFRSPPNWCTTAHSSRELWVDSLIRVRAGSGDHVCGEQIGPHLASRRRFGVEVAQTCSHIFVARSDAISVHVETAHVESETCPNPREEI